jgi:shikimate dehydrogenase
MLIDKDTKIFCSFSINPGNNGCFFFNEKFKRNNVNALYKSFFSDNIKKSIEAVKTLGISGFAVSMPFKIEILNYVDQVDEIAQTIGSCNTVINKGGKLIAYNTDWIGIKNYLLQTKIPSSVLLAGNGGFSKAAQFTFDKMKIPYDIITRNNWFYLQNTNKTIFNATPVNIENKKNLIDARPTEYDGKIIAKLQAEEQFKLYTQ